MRPFSDFEYIAIDVETRGLNWWEPKHGIFGIAISYPDGSDYYFDIRRQPEGIEWLKQQKPRKLINHNIKFDLHMLWQKGVKWSPEICDCTMIRASLIDEHLPSYSLDYLSKKYLNQTKQNDIYEDLSKVFGGIASRNVQIKNLHRADPELVANYAKKDTRLAMQLYEWQNSEIEKQSLHKICAFEKKLFPVIFDLERKGVKVNTNLAHLSVGKLTRNIDLLKKELDYHAGFNCNPNPSGDMDKLFRPKKDVDGNWIACDGTILPQTDGGKASINADALRSMVHPASDIILKIRKQMRCRDTFLKSHVLGHVHNNYLHPNINQVKGDNGGTGTGRLSYTKPALQQIPARDKDVAAIVRPIFIPDDDQVWACMDYEQFEFRMFAHYVKDPDILKLYSDNPMVDFHQIVADMTGLPRNAPMSGGPNAKQLNLSMIYDMGEASIARTLNMPLDPKINRFTDKKGNEIAYQKAGPEAQRIIEKYHSAIPGVRLLYEKVKSVGKSRGYVTSIAGRKMRYPNGKGLNKSKAILCQGSSADCMKQKMIELHDYFSTTDGCRMYISVHDEVNMGIPKNHPKFKSIIKDVKHILESFDKEPFKLRVPIKTDLGVGDNWAEASGKGC